MRPNPERISLPQDDCDRDVIYALRTIHQNQTQLIVLADQKANILVGIVAVVFTIIFTNSGFINSLNQWLLLPLSCFLLVEITAVFLALLVLLPKNTNRPRVKRIEDISNPLFFGAFTHFREDEFVSFLYNKLNNDAAAKQLLIQDIYQMGVVLRTKYSLLRYAYTFALVGVAFLLCLVSAFMLIK